MGALRERKSASVVMAYGGEVPSVRSDVRLVDLLTIDSVAEINCLTASSDSVVSSERSPHEKYSDYKRLVDRAVEVFGDDLIASRWLSMPSVDLEGKVPLQVAQAVEYEFGKMEEIFEPIFMRIEHGIYW